jgi:hypothetical protein
MSSANAEENNYLAGIKSQLADKYSKYCNRQGNEGIPLQEDAAKIRGGNAADRL